VDVDGDYASGNKSGRAQVCSVVKNWDRRREGAREHRGRTIVVAVVASDQVGSLHNESDHGSVGVKLTVFPSVVPIEVLLHIFKEPSIRSQRMPNRRFRKQLRF
jgi:hypothetical protein